MAQPPPTPSPAPPPYPRPLVSQSAGVLWAITAMAAALFVAVVASGIRSVTSFGPSSLLGLPFCGVFVDITILLVVIIATPGLSKHRISPSPPIQ